jgi:hypothetical protein
VPEQDGPIKRSPVNPRRNETKIDSKRRERVPAVLSQVHGYGFFAVTYWIALSVVLAVLSALSISSAFFPKDLVASFQQIALTTVVLCIVLLGGDLTKLAPLPVTIRNGIPLRLPGMRRCRLPGLRQRGQDLQPKRNGSAEAFPLDRSRPPSGTCWAVATDG